MRESSLEPESSASASSAISAYINEGGFREKIGEFPRKSAELVREAGLEPARDYHTPLKRARLPIPPFSLDNGDIITNGVQYVKLFNQFFYCVFNIFFCADGLNLYYCKM